MQAIVSIHDLHKSFGDVEVLKGVSMDVPKGAVVCIIGPSGSGKSTLLRCINGLVPIHRGSIRVGTFDVQTLKTDQQKIALRKVVSMVFQQYNLFPHKTALQNVMMAPIHVLKEDKGEVHARALALLEKVGLSAKADVYPGELSKDALQDLREKRAGPLHPGAVEQLRRRARFDDHAAVGEVHGVGQLAGEAHFMGHQDAGHAVLRQLTDRVEHFLDGLGVQRRRDLVEQHDVRMHRQRAGDRHTLLLAA